MEMFGVGIPSTLTFAYEPPTTRLLPFVEIVGMRRMYANMYELSDI